MMTGPYYGQPGLFSYFGCEPDLFWRADHKIKLVSETYFAARLRLSEFTRDVLP